MSSNKWLMVSFYPDKLSNEESYIIPWPQTIPEPEGFTRWMFHEKPKLGESPQGDYLCALLNDGDKGYFTNGPKNCKAAGGYKFKNVMHQSHIGTSEEAGAIHGILGFYI